MLAWLVAALIFGVPVGASVFAGLLMTSERGWMVPPGAGALLVVAFAVLLATDASDVAIGAVLGATLGYAFVTAAVLGTAYGVGVLLRRAPAPAGRLLGLVATLAGGAVLFLATVLIGLAAGCSESSDDCL